MLIACAHTAALGQPSTHLPVFSWLSQQPRTLRQNDMLDCAKILGLLVRQHLHDNVQDSSEKNGWFSCRLTVAALSNCAMLDSMQA